MRFSDLLRTAFLNLWRRKLRAFLTVLGMVIGTCSIVVMVSLGIGMKEAMIESYASMGSLNNITVMRWSYNETSDGKGESRETDLDEAAIKAIKAIPGVVAVMPRINANGILMSGRYVADVSILAIDMSVAELFDIALEEGTFPGSRVSGSKFEIVLGSDVLQYFYDPNNYEQALDRDGNPKVTMDSRLKFTMDYSYVYGGYNDDPSYQPGKIYRVTPTGVMSANNNEFSWYCLIDINVLEKLAKDNPNFISAETDNYNEVIVKCESTDIVQTVKAEIDAMGYGTNSLQDWIEQSEESLKQVQYLLGAIGGVSLLVAAIGIMNTMMMSIYERTREIGIIKVLGCRMSNIAALFLAEAAYIGVFGGALGLGFSYGLSILLNTVLSGVGMRSSIPLYLALGAVVFSMFVSMVSGLYPALRAMRLSPLAAIRNE